MMRVLLIDVNASQMVATDRPRTWAWAFFTRLGAYVQEIYANGTPATASVYSEQWDLIVIPYIRNIAGNYTTLQTHLARFADPTIPVYVQQACNASLAPSVTGVSAVAGADASVNMGALKSWSGRPGVCTWTGTFPTLAGMSGATVHADDGTNVALWSNTVSGHPVLWQCGTQNLSGAYVATFKVWKPWLAVQWACDIVPSIKARLTKLNLMLRYDGLELTIDDTQRAAGHLDTIYNKAASYGMKELWLAAMWAPGTYGAAYPLTAAWFEARGEQVGGLFRCMNHITDLVDGSTGGAGCKCTSDGVAFDLFATAASYYDPQCAELVAHGWKLGDDEYGRGYPNIQNSNDMNNPAAKFLSDRGVGALWVCSAPTKKYPSAPAASYTMNGVNVACAADGMGSWNGMPLLFGFTADALDPASAVNYGRNMNAGMLESFVRGGGAYIHGAGAAYLAAGADEYFGVLGLCPDVVESKTLETFLPLQRRGAGINVTT